MADSEAKLPMNRYLVRRSCEYSIPIVAPDEEQAAITASHIPESEWDKAWSDFEVEKSRET